MGVWNIPKKGTDRNTNDTGFGLIRHFMEKEVKTPSASNRERKKTQRDYFI